MAGGFNSPNQRPGLSFKPQFEVNPRKTSLTAPGGSGKGAPTPRVPKIGTNPRDKQASEERNTRYRSPGGSGSGAKPGFYNGKYIDVEAVKDRGKPVPKSYTQKQSEIPGSATGRAAPANRVKTQAQSPSAEKTGPSPTDGTPPPKPADNTPAPKRDKSSNGGNEKSPQTRPAVSSSANGKTVPAVPGTLNYFMRKAAAAGDKNVKARAYQMWKNSKNAPGKVTPAAMNVDAKDLPAKPSKGATVKGKRGVTWTWNGTRWARGKVA